MRSHRLIQREKQTTISTENPSNLCPPHSHLSGKKAVTLYFDGCRFPIGRSPELGVHRLHFGIAFDFWHRYKSSSWNFLNRSLLTRVPFNGKQRATTPWLQSHRLHAKERVSIAVHPEICQARIWVGCLQCPNVLTQRVTILSTLRYMSHENFTTSISS